MGWFKDLLRFDQDEPGALIDSGLGDGWAITRAQKQRQDQTEQRLLALETMCLRNPQIEMRLLAVEAELDQTNLVTEDLPERKPRIKKKETKRRKYS